MDKKRKEATREEKNSMDRDQSSLKRWRNLALAYHIFYLVFVQFFLDNWIDDPSPHFAYLQGAICLIGLIVLIVSSYGTHKVKSRLEEKSDQKPAWEETKHLIRWTYILFAACAYQDAHSLYRALERLYDLGF